MPQFSIITAFRNRDLQRVKNSLDSLSAQTYTDFELIFIDYGSSPELSQQTEMLIANYPFAKYYFTETRGWFWSRAHALNTGIKPAKGNISILWDIDLMVEPDFLASLQQFNIDSVFTTHRCYYLPEQFTIENYKTAEILNKSEHSYVGLCVVKTSVLNAIEGFDEFYQVWGAEDDDLYNRIEALGYQKQMVDATQIPVYHQWHPTQAPALPDLWYLTMLDRLYAQPPSDRSKRSDGYWRITPTGGVMHTQNRPAFAAFETKSYLNGIREELIFWNHTFLYNLFMNKFNAINSGELIYIEHTYAQMNFSTKSQRIISVFNKLMKNRRLNLRLSNEIQEKHIMLKDNIYSFLKYFVGTHRHQLTDYYLDWREDGFVFIAIKN